MLEVPIYRQQEAFCGPAVFRSVLAYYGVRKSQKEANVLCKTTFTAGTSERKLASAFRKLGFHTVVKEKGTWEILNEYVNRKKIPVVVGWFSVSDSHYSVVAGLTKRHIWLIDPEHRTPRKLSWPRFNHLWFSPKFDYAKYPNDVLKHSKDVRLQWYLVAFPAK